ncbi:hypothetical protein [Paraburkholderia sp. DGU8]|uniref:hypothetical protein n=1 Tax=Paraburkholderia sp. DGU8 TaxID=3161997 RepID=UPI003467CB25
MSSSEIERRRDELPFFMSPEAYAPVLESNSGQFSIATEIADHRRAMLCFLSCIDALIETEQFARLGHTWHVKLASQIDQDLFRNSDGHGVIADVHLGWPASDRRIVPGRAYESIWSDTASLVE